MSSAYAAVSGRERALAHIREQILGNPAVQGTFINEQRLATDIGVSRTPVREALLILASEGLVQMLPKRGAYVPPLSGRQITELMELRGLLERHAASRAVLLGHQPGLAMAPILQSQRSMVASHHDHQATEFIELDRQFHQTMIDSAVSELLSRTYAGLRERQVRVGVAALQQGPARWQQVCDEHQAIVDALATGDIDAVHRSIDDHLAITLATLLVI